MVWTSILEVLCFSCDLGGKCPTEGPGGTCPTCPKVGGKVGVRWFRVSVVDSVSFSESIMVLPILRARKDYTVTTVTYRSEEVTQILFSVLPLRVDVS